ncbi:MAG: hypothetical protein WCO54_10160 [Bacteroidota bacterium]
MKKFTTVLFLIISITAFSQTFPTLNCETLNNKKVNIPDDVKGKKTVVAIAMSSKAEKQLKAWNTPLYNSLIADGLGGLMGGRMYDANLCFVGMIKGIAKLAKGEIMERSRKNIDKKLHDNFMITEQEVNEFIKAADVKDKNEPQFFVLDKDGKIIYHTAGEYSDKKLNELTEKLMY